MMIIIIIINNNNYNNNVGVSSLLTLHFRKENVAKSALKLKKSDKRYSYSNKFLLRSSTIRRCFLSDNGDRHTPEQSFSMFVLRHIFCT